MILPDVNVLLHAFRSDSPQHIQYLKWLEDTINGDAAYGMSPQALSAVVRIATHPRIFVQPSRLPEVMAFATTLMSHSHCQLIQPGPRHWGIFESLCRQAHAAGNLVQDAWYAALAIESGCEWITTDLDFSRFHGLRWRRPL
jgi:toxin-antitoxin system PIN domain toxin